MTVHDYTLKMDSEIHLPFEELISSSPDLVAVNPLFISNNDNCNCSSHVCKKQLSKAFMTCEDQDCSENHFSIVISPLVGGSSGKITSIPCEKYTNPPIIDIEISFNKITQSLDNIRKKKNNTDLFSRFKKSDECEQCKMIDYSSLLYPHKIKNIPNYQIVTPKSKLVLDKKVSILFPFKELVNLIISNFNKIYNYGSHPSDNHDGLNDLYANLCTLLIVFDRSYLPWNLSIFGKQLKIQKLRNCIHTFLFNLNSEITQISTLIIDSKNQSFMISTLAKSFSSLVILCCVYFLYNESDIQKSVRVLLINIGKNIDGEDTNLRTRLLSLAL